MQSWWPVCLLEGLYAGTYPGEEERQADSLEDTCDGADGNGIEWALLSEDLSDELAYL